MFEDKFKPESIEGQRLISQFAGKEVYVFHLTKIAARRELKSIFESSEATL